MTNINVKIEEINNLSRIPVRVSDNPIFGVSKILLKDIKNETDSIVFLKKYYENLSYSCLNDLYKTNLNTLSRFKYYEYFFPWIHTSPVTRYRDDAFITKISEEEIVYKVKKVQSLIKSISQNGYDPSKFPDRKNGNITGYFLKNEKKRSFYVVSGNHRVAVLSALGYENIPVSFEKVSFFKPRDWENFGLKEHLSVYDRKNVENWPGVSSGFMSKGEAVEIMERFLTV